MDWYIPITILPGVGMLILSTVTQMMSLSAEIGEILKNKCTPFQHKISHQKIKQLRKLTIASALLYISAGCFVLSGIIGALSKEGTFTKIPNLVLIIGVLLVLAALGLLIMYSSKAIQIRQAQHEHNEEL